MVKIYHQILNEGKHFPAKRVAGNSTHGPDYWTHALQCMQVHCLWWLQLHLLGNQVCIDLNVTTAALFANVFALDINDW